MNKTILVSYIIIHFAFTYASCVGLLAKTSNSNIHFEGASASVLWLKLLGHFLSVRFVLIYFIIIYIIHIIKRYYFESGF